VPRRLAAGGGAVVARRLADSTAIVTITRCRQSLQKWSKLIGRRRKWSEVIGSWRVLSKPGCYV
jgi:hypothetical protein